MRSPKLTCYDSYIFDFDGTLARLTVDWDGLRREVRSICYCAIDGEPLSLGAMVQRVVERDGRIGRAELADVIRKYEQPGGEIRLARVYDRVVTFAKSQRCFFVVSNNLHSTVDKGLAALGLTPLCGGVVGFDDVLRSKPSDDGYRLLRRKCRIGGAAAYIGDSLVDEEFATNAAIGFVPVEDICAGY